MTEQEKGFTSGGVVQVGTRREMETMLQGLRDQLKRAGEFLDPDTVKRLQGRISDIGEQQRSGFGTQDLDSKHIVNMKAYAQALTAINQAVKTEQIAAVEKPLGEVMKEFKDLAPELAKLRPQVLKDMFMALTQGEGVKGVRARAEAAGVTGSQVGGWENFEARIMKWQQSYNLSEPDQFKVGIAGATAALKPFVEALADATAAHAGVKTDIKKADEAVTAAKRERAMPVGAPGVLSSAMPAIQGAMKNAMPTLIPLLLPKLAPMLPKMTPLSSTDGGAGDGTAVSESFTSLKKSLDTLMSVFAAMNKDASEFRVGATGPLASKENVEHKHEIDPLRVDVNFVGAQVFSEDHISTPMKNYVELRVGEEIRKVTDNLGQTRDPSSGTPIGQK